MATRTLDPIITEEPTLPEVQRFYDEVLRDRLEPQHNDEFVAIDICHRTYAVSNDALDAFHKLEAMGRRPPFVLMRIGHEAVYEGFSG